jgi:predicted DNA-binding transcriptional regulator AlpA
MKSNPKAREAETLPDHPILPVILQEIHVLKAMIREIAANDHCTETPRPKFVCANEAMKMTGCRKSKFWARQNPKHASWDPTFPLKFKLGDSENGPTYYYVDEINAWVNSRASRRVH